MFSPIWIRTRVLGFKVPSDNHYTIGESSIRSQYTRGMHGVGFEPTQLTLPGLKSGSLDHSDNRAYEHFKACSSLLLTGGLEPPTFALLIKASISAV